MKNTFTSSLFGIQFSVTLRDVTSPSIFSQWTKIQSEERQVGHVNVNVDIDIFVYFEPKWLKFGLQAHFFKMFGYAKFQLSIFFALSVMKLLVQVSSGFH